MKILIVLFISFSVFAQDKVAIIIGDDFKGDTNMEDFGIKTAEALKARGFSTLNLYGTEKRASEIEAKHSLKTKSFTLDNLKDQLNKVYAQDCANRPNQLMLNFVTHGSYNGGNHILNTRKEIGPTPVRSIANHIKKLKSQNPGCDKPLLAVIDTSCKSGGSIKEFKGLGCTLTTTSSYNQTSFGFIEDVIKKIKSSQKISNLSELHMDMILNRDYELLEKDYQDGKTVLKRLFDNSNQIAGCYDEQKADFNIGLNKSLVQTYAPQCEDPTSVLYLRRQKEIEEIESIVNKLKLSKDLDKDTIATLWNKPASSLPSSKELSSKIIKLIADDKAKSAELNKVLEKESMMMSNPELEKTTACRLKIPSGINRNEANKINNILTSNTSTFTDQKTAIAKILCHIHSSEESFGSCARYASRGALNLSYAELFRLKKDYDYLMTQFKEIEANKAIAINRKIKKIDLNIPSLFKMYQKSINDCFEGAKKSDNPEISQAANFVSSQYGVDKSKCSSEISCHIAKANIRESKIKDYLALSRAYFFLECKQEFNQSEDLKACDDFKL